MSVGNKQILTRDPALDWSLCQSFFEDRVTDRDFLISSTSLDDWKKLFALIKQNPSWTAGEPGSAGALGEVSSAMFRSHGGKGGCFFIRLEHGVLVCLWPTAPEFIEMDVEAHRVQSAQALSALLDFMESVALALRRTIALAYDLEPQYGLIEYVWETKQFVYQTPSGE